MKVVLFMLMSFALSPRPIDVSKLLNLNNLVKNEYLTQDIFSKEEMVFLYKKMGYKLIYIKPYNIKQTNNCFFIFEHEIGNKNFKQNRVLVSTKLISSNKYKLQYKLEDIIHDKDYTNTCYYGINKEAFRKIVIKGLYMTIEQNCCTKRQGETVHEYLTFKFDMTANDFFLNKYSIEIEVTNHVDNNVVKDFYPKETLTEKDFGKLKLKEFSYNELNKYKDKFPANIYEIIK
jgi:hypothetical protein